MSPETASAIVEETAAQRAPESHYTIADAITDARFYRAHPEILIDGQKAKRVIDALLAALERSQSYLKAIQRGQEVFVLVEQDRAAPSVILAWATAAEEHGCESEKVNDAYHMAVRWSQQDEANTKWPD